jgi:glycopeptide antibiotics resistance protein
MRDHYAILLCAFLSFVIYGSLTPWRFEPMPAGQAASQFRQRLFVGPWIVSVTDIVDNVALMIPAGFLASGALLHGRSSSAGRWQRWLLTAAVIAGGFVLALSLEFAQLFVPSRFVSPIDVVSETTGTAMGVTLWRVLNVWTIGHAAG